MSVSKKLIHGREMSAIIVLLRRANLWPMRYGGIDVVSLHRNRCRLSQPDRLHLLPPEVRCKHLPMQTVPELIVPASRSAAVARTANDCRGDGGESGGARQDKNRRFFPIQFGDFERAVSLIGA